MEQLRWNQIEGVLQGALDVDPAEREVFLRRACGSDSDLRRRVDELLAGESAGMALEEPAIAALVPHLASPSLIGRRISHYRIEERIGAGGMGEVYLAHDEALQRKVALKTLPPEFIGNAERAQRFEQEAFAASRLNHPNIITIFEVVSGEGTQWIATEHVEGKTLRQLLNDKSLTTARAVDIAFQVAAALKAAHTAWIIHRDIKPENIMVRPDGVAKVLDFGIAKLNEAADGVSAGRPSASPHLTAVGAVLGTASYMSPEQARGEPLDGRTDIYSLGLVLREMLAGARVPKALTRIVERMLRPDRDARYASVAELLDDLADVRRRLETTAVRRLMGMSAIAAAVAVVLVAIAAYLSVTERWDERVLRDGHTAAARRAIFSPDGKRILTTGEDGQVIVWDFATRERVATVTAHPADMVSYAPDGRSFATGGLDGTIVIWDASTLRRVRSFRHGTGSITALAHSPDGALLASSDRQTNVVWRTATGERIREWAEGVSYGTFVFSDANRQLVSGAASVGDIQRGSLIETARAGANWIALAPDRSHLAIIDSDGDVSFYRYPGDDLSRPELVERVRAHQDHGRSVAYSPDGQLLASGAEDIVLWETNLRRKVARFSYESIVWNVAFSPDGRWLLSSHGDGAVLIWDVAERACVASLNAHSGGVRAVAFDVTGRRLASAGDDRAVVVWDLGSGRKERVLAGHDSRVTGIAFLPDGKRLASVDHSVHTVVWDLATRGKTVELRPAWGNSYCLAASPDGRHFVTTQGLYTTGDGRARLLFTRRDWRYAAPYGVAFSPDGQSAFAATSGGWVLRWDVRSGRLAGRHNLAHATLIAISLSPDGRWLVTGEDEGAVRLWSVDPLRPVAILGRHRARVKAVAFAPDGKTVASAGDDKVISLWNVERRTLRAHIGTHTSPVYALAFSPDGRHLASGEHDRSVRVYTRRRTLWGYELE